MSQGTSSRSRDAVDDRREDLAAAVFEECVASFEARAADLGDHDDGVVTLLDFILDTHHGNRSLAHVFLRSDAACVERLRAAPRRRSRLWSTEGGETECCVRTSRCPT